jgi:hypothetical protein
MEVTSPCTGSICSLPLDERDNRHAVRNKVDRIVMILIVDKLWARCEVPKKITGASTVLLIERHELKIRHAVRNKVDRIVMILIIDKQALGTFQSLKKITRASTLLLIERHYAQNMPLKKRSFPSHSYRLSF